MRRRGTKLQTKGTRRKIEMVQHFKRRTSTSPQKNPHHGGEKLQITDGAQRRSVRAKGPAWKQKRPKTKIAQHKGSNENVVKGEMSKQVTDVG